MAGQICFAGLEFVDHVQVRPLFFSHFCSVQGIQGPKGDIGSPGIQGPPGLKVSVLELEKYIFYLHLDFLLWLTLWFFYLQGEKGEPGIIKTSDGTLVSGLPGPAGPRGVKVLKPF